MFGTEEIGAAIKAARKKNGYTQEALAELLGVTPTHIKHIESGRRLPSVEILFSAAKHLHFSLDDLVQTDDTSPQTPASTLEPLLLLCSKKELALLEEIVQAIIKYR